jgi:hypothetical protein
MENDEVFVPATRGDHGTPAGGLAEAVEESPLGSWLGIARMLLVGWPGYLLANFSGPAKYRGQDNSHFSPLSVLYSRRQSPLIVLSDAGLLAAGAAIYAAARTWGWVAVGFWYGAPYLVVNAHLVLITFLQHTDAYVPHYRGEAFTWLRGALATVDRSFGPLLDDALHHIADSHVVHHLFHTVSDGGGSGGAGGALLHSPRRLLAPVAAGSPVPSVSTALFYPSFAAPTTVGHRHRPSCSPPAHLTSADALLQRGARDALHQGGTGRLLRSRRPVPP